MWRGLAAVRHCLQEGTRVVVVRGDGPSFSAGIDLRLFTPEGVPGEDGIPPLTGPGFEDWIAACQEGFTWLHDPGIVTVAAVRGHAIGAGFQLALACDLRVLADDAQLCMKEAALGLVPDLAGTKPLVDLVGPARALELCLTARTVRAAEAGRIGLAELVVPAALPASIDRRSARDSSTPGMNANAVPTSVVPRSAKPAARQSIDGVTSSTLLLKAAFTNRSVHVASNAAHAPPHAAMTAASDISSPSSRRFTRSPLKSEAAIVSHSCQ